MATKGRPPKPAGEVKSKLANVRVITVKVSCPLCEWEVYSPQWDAGVPRTPHLDRTDIRELTGSESPSSIDCTKCGARLVFSTAMQGWVRTGVWSSAGKSWRTEVH